MVENGSFEKELVVRNWKFVNANVVRCLIRLQIDCLIFVSHRNCRHSNHGPYTGSLIQLEICVPLKRGGPSFRCCNIPCIWDSKESCIELRSVIYSQEVGEK